jgi:hypothetical protein
VPGARAALARPDPGSRLYQRSPRVAWASLLAGLAALGFCAAAAARRLFRFTSPPSRDFFGVLKIFEAPNANPTRQDPRARERRDHARLPVDRARRYCGLLDELLSAAAPGVADAFALARAAPARCASA